MSLTSPEPSSAAPIWISSPRFHSRCVDPVQPAADGRYPALPFNTGIDTFAEIWVGKFTSLETIRKDLWSWIFYFCYTANKDFISHCRKFWYSLPRVVFLRFASDSWEVSLIINSKKVMLRETSFTCSCFGFFSFSLPVLYPPYFSNRSKNLWESRNMRWLTIAETSDGSECEM